MAEEQSPIVSGLNELYDRLSSREYYWQPINVDNTHIGIFRGFEIDDPEDLKNCVIILACSIRIYPNGDVERLRHPVMLHMLLGKIGFISKFPFDELPSEYEP